MVSTWIKQPFIPPLDARNFLKDFTFCGCVYGYGRGSSYGCDTSLAGSILRAHTPQVCSANRETTILDPVIEDL